MQTTDPHAFKPLDPGRIEILDPLEVAYWCKDLHCSEAELQAAVNDVGSHVAAVRQWLEKAHPERYFH